MTASGECSYCGVTTSRFSHDDNRWDCGCRFPPTDASSSTVALPVSVSDRTRYPWEPAEGSLEEFYENIKPRENRAARRKK